MFRDVPGCSGMFRDVPCSGFYRRPLIALKDPKSVIKLVLGIVMIFTFVKLSDGSMIGRLNTSSV